MVARQSVSMSVYIRLCRQAATNNVTSKIAQNAFSQTSLRSPNR
jgi:hypothetical protein